MKITIITVGSRGDVQPFVALAVGLQKAQHSVRLCATVDFAEFVKSYDIDFFPISDSMQELLQSDSAKETIESGSILKFIQFKLKNTKELFNQVNGRALEACTGSDLIIFKNSIPIAESIGEKLNIPCIEVGLWPFTPTAKFPCIAFSGKVKLGRALNKISHNLLLQFSWQASRKSVNQVRKKNLGLPALSRFSAANMQKKFGIPMLYAYSENVIPRPFDWDDKNYIAGYWFLGSNKQWKPSEELLNFLATGEKPVYIGFGSSTNESSEEFLALIVKALETSHSRGILLSGWGNLGKGAALPENIFQIDEAPHEWLFPKMCTIVHHGGAGTTAAGLRSGVPSIVIPHCADQPFWAQRIYELGVGPAPISLKVLTSENLAEAIIKAKTDKLMIEKAAALGEKISQEQGVSKAIEYIETIVKN